MMIILGGLKTDRSCRHVLRAEKLAAPRRALPRLSALTLLCLLNQPVLNAKTRIPNSTMSNGAAWCVRPHENSDFVQTFQIPM